MLNDLVANKFLNFDIIVEYLVLFAYYLALIIL